MCCCVTTASAYTSAERLGLKQNGVYTLLITSGLQKFDIAIKTRKGLTKKHVDESARLKPCASLLKKNCSQMLGTAQPFSVRPC